MFNKLTADQREVLANELTWARQRVQATRDGWQEGADTRWALKLYDDATAAAYRTSRDYSELAMDLGELIAELAS